MTIRKHSSGGRFEQVASYSRAKRVGPFVYVAGTTAIEPSGKLHAPGDTYAQTCYILHRIEEALEAVGAQLRHVMRTRAYMTDLGQAGEYAKAHGDVFRTIDPVTSAVQAGLTQPGLMIEIDVDAIVFDDDGLISYER